jgi:hypothetical protein
MIFSLFAAGLSCLPAWACTPDAGQEHRPKAGYHFKTQSYVRSYDPTPVGVTCVQNLTSNWMEVHWFIPGSGGWGPPSELSPPWERFLRTQKYQSLEGCLEYGNLGETTKAGFHGDAIDHESVVEEKRIGCTAARNKYHSVAMRGDNLEKMTTLSIPVKILFPSDVEKPGDTMLVLSGEVKVVPGEQRRYSILFDLKISRYEGADQADSSQIFVKPSFDARVASLWPMFKEHLGEMLPIDKLSGTRIDVAPAEGTVAIEQASMEIVSANGRILARLGFPVYIFGA